MANSVVDTGDNRGYFNLSVWRGSQNLHTYNARIMEGILSLVWFYSTDRPWNPELGAVSQSQSRTDVAAYGTKPENGEQVYEAAGINARFLLGGKTIDLKPGKMDVEPGELNIRYKLGDEGHKSVSLKKNKIEVSIEHSGEFTEILPLLVSSKDELIIDKNRIQLKCERVNMVIQLSDSIAVQSNNFESDLTKKECKVIEVKASRKLNYKILFE